MMIRINMNTIQKNQIKKKSKEFNLLKKVSLISLKN